MKNQYKIKDMRDWRGVEADLIITDPPFGIEFDGKNGNYNRDTGNVVEGYVEWDKGKYKEEIEDLLDCINTNLSDNGQALIFSGWNNSHEIHRSINEFQGLNLEGKLYWNYNFAPYCKKRPAHNVYEIYWMVKGDDWYYNNECDYDHCQDGEGNLSAVPVKRDYKKEMPKYPTRLPLKMIFILLDHFSKEEDLVFDPLAGSGMVGIGSEIKNRNWVVGDLNKEGKRVFKELVDFYKGEGHDLDIESSQKTL